MSWIVLTTMTMVTALVLVRPLWVRRGPRGSHDIDVAFHESLLAEVDDDVSRGLVAAEDAAPTRTEIARRLLARPDPSPPFPQAASRPRPTLRALGTLAIAIALPCVALPLYVREGAIGRPDMPIASRRPGAATDLAALITKAEARLSAEPADGQGFRSVAPLYMRMGRFQDAARAYGAALRLLGENAADRASMGQALVAAADGVVTTTAHVAFDAALADDPKQPIARFFEALAAEQGGDGVTAAGVWTALQADSPTDAPWADAVRSHLADLSQAAEPGAEAAPATVTAARIAALPPEQRSAAVHGMVKGLASRLAEDGRDPEGWLRLIRAYSTLGERAEAEAAVARARTGLADDAQAVSRLDALVRTLGLKG